MSNQNKLQAVMLKLLTDDAEHYPHFLEQRFPHILQRMIALWGKPEMADYLDGLLAPPLAGSKGFPQEALLEIIAIKAIHRAKFPDRERQVSHPEIDKSPLAEPPKLPKPFVNAEHDAEHEAAMVFDRTHRW